MNLFSVDQTKCSRDGLCVMECPMRIISMNGNVPEPVENAEKLCINCGHCVAVCPHGALSLQTMPVEQCLSLQGSWRIPPEQMEQLLKGRRSVRLYRGKAVERRILEQVLDFARFAPSARNSQPLSWIVIQKPDRVKDLAEIVIDWMRAQLEEESVLAKMLNVGSLISAWDKGYDAICRSAPHLVIAHAPQANKGAIIDASIALSYAELAALSFDLGSCWAGYFHVASTHSPELQAALGLPEKHQSLGTLMLGYPKLQHHRIPLRNEARIAWN